LDTPDTLPFTGTTPYGRPSWSGLLQFSLVGIPLKAYPAVRTRDVPSAHLLHADCGQRLCYAKHCPVHGPVDNAAIVKGYEYGPGRHVIAQPEELDELRPVQDKALRLERFLAPTQPAVTRVTPRLDRGGSDRLERATATLAQAPARDAGPFVNYGPYAVPRRGCRKIFFFLGDWLGGGGWGRWVCGPSGGGRTGGREPDPPPRQRWT